MWFGSFLLIAIHISLKNLLRTKLILLLSAASREWLNEKIPEKKLFGIESLQSKQRYENNSLITRLISVYRKDLPKLESESVSCMFRCWKMVNVTT